MQRPLLIITLASSLAKAATTVSLSNFSGVTSGFPIVDNSGDAIVADFASWAVGTFPEDFFSANVLDESTDDQFVIDSFSQSGETGTFGINGLFSGAISSDDGNTNLNEPVFALITYQPSPSCVQALVIDLGQNFPEQDMEGNASISLGRLPEPSDVAFGGTAFQTVNTDSLPLPFASFTQGLGFGDNLATPTCTGVPEPSSVLFGLTAFSTLCLRRRTKRR